MFFKKEIFIRNILKWHKINEPEFPWRKTKNKYEILIAEILLKKTTRNQVLGIYSSFIDKYPDVQSLAEANVFELKNRIKCLGIQEERSKLLLNFANYINDKLNGIIPENIPELMNIPGVGRYSANALLCLINNSNLPLVDTNTIRVLVRVFNVKSDKKRVRNDKAIWDFAEKLLPRRDARNFNLAVLDFANQICLSRSPKCLECPAKRICTAFIHSSF